MRIEGDHRGLRYGTSEVEELDDRPLPELLRELVGESQTLLREEVRLAKAEIRNEAKKAAKGGAELGAGGAVAYVALFCLAATLIVLGDLFLPLWLSAAIVTVLFAIVGFALIQGGRKQIQHTRPARAVDHLKEDKEWAKETMRSVRSSRHGHA
ncbi:MAG TPA: phage holin family protein [Anaeromyxobacteraceae bacterium]|nr:phage holin family protein [Anaeromyxobacteraceae bacterium]